MKELSKILSIITAHFKFHYPFWLAILTAYLIILIGIFNYEGAQEGYGDFFIRASLIAPFLYCSLSKRSFIPALIRGIGITFIIIVAMELFWNYQDHPWFEPPRVNCDGPCYGWFSFENPAPVWDILRIGVTGSIIGTVLSFVFKRSRKIVNL